MGFNNARQLRILPHHSAISSTITCAIERDHSYMLRKLPVTLAELDARQRLFCTLNETGEFEHSCTVVSLVPEGWRADPRLRIDELGGLIAGPGRQRGGERASAVVRRAIEARRAMDGNETLFVATSRGRESARVLAEAGLTPVSIAEFYMLFGGCSCDQECLEGPEGQPAWLGCGERTECAACSSVAEGIRSDACHGYVSDLALAWEKELLLRAMFHDNALELRTAIARGFAEEDLAGVSQ